MRHYDELELLEAAYLPATEASAIESHVSSCAICAARRKTVEQTMDRSRRQLDQVVDSKPESFWKRQQLAVSRAALAEAHERRHRAPRLAAAAALLMVLSGVLAYQHRPVPVAVVATTTMTETTIATQTALVEPTISIQEATTDPWESDQLKDYQGLVEWESWMQETPSKGTL